MRTSIQAFIQDNRSEIDAAIARALSFTPKQASCSCPLSRVRDHYCGDPPRLDDEDREQWILNDEGLYQWALSEGVNV